MSSKICAVDKCARTKTARLWCDMHYRRWLHNGDPLITRRKNHGMRDYPEYSVWFDMKRRCNNKGHRDYKNYGGRGIRVCERWLNNFASFIEDIGRRPTKLHTLERLDNSGDYCPSNVKWATRKEQNRNTRNTFWVEYKGRKMSLAEASELSGADYELARQRIKYRGWNVNEALIKHKYRGKYEDRQRLSHTNTY